MKCYLLGAAACCLGVVCKECFDVSFVGSLLIAGAAGGLFAAIDCGIKKMKKRNKEQKQK